MNEVSDRYKIMTVIPCWKRPDILKLCLQNLQWFAREVKTWDVTTLLVVSPDDPDRKAIEKIARTFGVKVVYYTNLPVSAKLNAGIHYALKHYEWDYLMNFGSDDLIHPKIEDLYAPLFKQNALFFGVNNLWFYDCSDRSAWHFKTYNDIKAIGAGRMIHRSIVESFIEVKRYPLYPNDIDRGMDTASSNMIWQYLKMKDTVIQSGDFPYIVDVKTNTNINHMIYIKSIKDRIRPMDVNVLRTHYKHLAL